MPDIGKLKQVTLEQVHIIGVSCGGAKQMKKVDIATIEWRGNAYEGVYEVTPSAQTQVLATAEKRALHDIVINPIPNNYGLITWNGSTLTVS